MSSTPKKLKILFLCTGNSARSILGEYLLREMAPSRFQTFSAGAKPTGKVNPLVLQCLNKTFHIQTPEARSKSWEEFKNVTFDIVITVCDHAHESCPIWQGNPIQAHWNSQDPAHFEGSDNEKLLQIREVASQIKRRLEALCAIELETIDHKHLKNKLAAISTIF
jgi:arsenate reductase (thioredoxin)